MVVQHSREIKYTSLAFSPPNCVDLAAYTRQLVQEHQMSHLWCSAQLPAYPHDASGTDGSEPREFHLASFNNTSQPAPVWKLHHPRALASASTQGRLDSYNRTVCHLVILLSARGHLLLAVLGRVIVEMAIRS